MNKSSFIQRKKTLKFSKADKSFQLRGEYKLWHVHYLILLCLITLLGSCRRDDSYYGDLAQLVYDIQYCGSFEKSNHSGVRCFEDNYHYCNAYNIRKDGIPMAMSSG